MYSKEIRSNIERVGQRYKYKLKVEDRTNIRTNVHSELSWFNRYHQKAIQMIINIKIGINTERNWQRSSLLCVNCETISRVTNLLFIESLCLFKNFIVVSTFIQNHLGCLESSQEQIYV